MSTTGVVLQVHSTVLFILVAGKEWTAGTLRTVRVTLIPVKLLKELYPYHLRPKTLAKGDVQGFVA